MIINHLGWNESEKHNGLTGLEVPRSIHPLQRISGPSLLIIWQKRREKRVS